MHNSTLKPISKKQAAKNKTWKGVTLGRIERLGNRCEWCGKWGTPDAEFNPLWGHHMEKRWHGDYSEANCFICHWICHREIEDNSIQVYRGIHGVWAEGDKQE